MKQLALILVIFSCISCSTKENKMRTLTGNAFGTTYTIQYFSERSFDPEKGIDSVFYVVNRSVSTYMPKSDISQINKGDSTIIIDDIFREVYTISEVVFNASEGYFDPTIGVLRNAYGFGDVTPLTEINELVLDSLRRFVGFSKVKITSEGTIRKQYPEIYFDFNAVAKGYGIDCLGDYFENQGVENFIIELGGEVLARGTNLKKDQPWTAGVEAVTSPLENRTYSVVVSLTNEAMAASGNYRKFRIDPITGQKYVHTINPLTGLAEQSDVTSATVIAPSCALADAYATTFMAMGLEKSRILLEKLEEIEAYLTYLDSLDMEQIFVTEGFRKKVNKS